MTKTLIVIPARGGSKRLPGKNVMSFCGKPLLAYSIESALNASIDADVIVSSDDDVILSIAEKFGAQPIKRPKEISGDFSTTFSAIKHSYNHMIKKHNCNYDYILTLQATNPIRPINLIESMIIEFQKNPSADSVVSVTKLKEKFGKTFNGYYQPENYQFNQRSQDIDPLYYENGLAYICTPKTIEGNSMFGKKVIAYACDEKFPIVDIDEKIDFEIAEIIYKKLNQS
jgi:N-acylneuraminate cytidylyltransferase